MEVEKEWEAEGEQTDFLHREIKDKSPNKGKWFKNRSVLKRPDMSLKRNSIHVIPQKPILVSHRRPHEYRARQAIDIKENLSLQKRKMVISMYLK